MTKQKNSQAQIKSRFVIAKSEDGTIQISFFIPFKDIEKSRQEVLSELAKEIEIPGFRKGFAPLSRVKEKVSENTLLEKTLTKILPKLVSEAVSKENIKPAIYPRFEVIKAKEGEDWQIRAITCELPDVNLGNYKKEIEAKAKSNSIWTPDKARTMDSSQVTAFKTTAEKEQWIMKSLLELINVKIPKILIDEEANSRLSKLLQRLEKLALSLESYLASIGKKADDLRREYEKQAADSIALDLILTKIAEEENLQVDPKDIQKALEAANADPKLSRELNTPEQRKFIKAILKRRKALSYLTSLITKSA